MALIVKHKHGKVVKIQIHIVVTSVDFTSPYTALLTEDKIIPSSSQSRAACFRDIFLSAHREKNLKSLLN